VLVGVVERPVHEAPKRAVDLAGYFRARGVGGTTLCTFLRSGYAPAGYGPADTV